MTRGNSERNPRVSLAHLVFSTLPKLLSVVTDFEPFLCFANIASGQTIDVGMRAGHATPRWVRHSAVRLASATRRDLLLEVLALRHQLAVLARSNRRFRRSDVSRCGISNRPGIALRSRKPAYDAGRLLVRLQGYLFTQVGMLGSALTLESPSTANPITMTGPRCHHPL